MSSRLNPNCKLPCRNYIFVFDGYVWRCVESTIGDAVGLLFSEFCDLYDIVFPDDANYLFCCTSQREIKIRKFGNEIDFYINPLNCNDL